MVRGRSTAVKLLARVAPCRALPKRQVAPALPSGDTTNPDVIFTQAGQITVNLTTTNIPQGTTLTVRVATDGEALTAQSTPTDASGNVSATLTVPAGFGTIQAYAEYTVTP
jgi:phage-related tail fiber protein